MRYALPQGVEDLPALAQALSPQAMLGVFGRYLPPRDNGVWAGCILERLSYKPGKSSRVLYRLWKEGEPPPEAGPPHYFYVEFLPPARSLGRFLDLKARGGASAPSGFVAELNMIYWEFPADPRLSQLASVWREGTWNVVSYTPTMGCVLSGHYGHEPTIVKLYHDDRVERVAQVMEALRAAGFAAPRVLNVEVPRRLLVMEHVPGAPFWSNPKAHLEREVMAAMARKVAALHATQLAVETRGLLEHVPHVAREWRRYGEACAELSEAFPDLRPRLERLTTMLGEVPGEPEAALLHGDFHPAQFLIERGTPRLIDFDNLCLGDPMYDLARFASHLYYKGHVYGHPLRDVERVVSSFRAAYIAAAGSRFEAPRWFWHLAVSLVAKRAHRVLTRLEADAQVCVRHLVTIAEQNAASILRS